MFHDLRMLGFQKTSEKGKHQIQIVIRVKKRKQFILNSIKQIKNYI